MKPYVQAATIGMVVALALAGCGRTADSTGVSGASESGTLVDDSPATGTIQVWTAGGYQPALEGILDGFAEDNPDAKVVVTDIPWAELPTKVKTSIAGGTVPDLVMIGQSQVPAMIATGGLQAVPDGIADLSGFYPDAVTAGKGEDGTQYSIPWYVETRLFFYRTDLAEQAGIEPPTTWDEIAPFAQALGEQEGVASGLVLPVGQADSTFQFMIPLISQAGGTVLDTQTGKWTFDTPEVVEALTYYKSFFDAGIADTAGYGDNFVADFVSGKTGSMVSGSWMAPMLESIASPEFVDQNVGAVVMPKGPVNNDSYIGGAQWSVFRDAENSDSAWKLVRYLSTKEAQQDLYDTNHDLPALRAAWDDDPLLKADEWSQLSMEQLENTQLEPAVPAWDELTATIGIETEKVVHGTSTPEDAAAAMQAKADSLGLGW